MTFAVAFVLAAADVLGTVVAFTASVLLRDSVLPGWTALEPFRPVRDYASLWPVLGLLVALRAAFGLYPGYARDEAEVLRAQTLSTALLFCFVAAGGTLFRFGEDYSRVVLASASVLMLIGLPLLRSFVRHRLATTPWYGLPVAVVGAGPRRDRLVRTLEGLRVYGLRPVAPEAADDARIQTCLLVPDRIEGRDLTDVLDGLSRRFRRVWLFPDLLDVASVWVTPRDVDGRLALELRNNLLEPRNRVAKRLLDLSLTALALPLALPLLAFLALLVRLEGGGPVLHRQARVGRDGRTITIVKFRTMRVDASAALERLLSRDAEARAEWEARRKLRDDPRVTRVGRLLRRTSLDELPQLWNVLRGDMSLVGPRPVMQDELARYGDCSGLYLRMLPGLTGLVQVSGRSELAYDERVRLDAYYARNWSLWLDLVILGRTVRTVLSRRGAY